ncbi:hypothetical protein [Paenibacillus polymyxa]|uniref:Uncharacterized protein n=1 Tax=Paenibacillus polymyxa (strain SC2) TaxID=886882 RepID=E3EL96_PAEPS|nr:hypothetical protein [Paenibacillus polymyxa]ADO59928.1 hypothetical protein PPSC2_28530 [Paenibacillus polymyxa SC2]WPQ59848.1 hypothetical protein SKN87_26540 [Paenibacillus polymyxa]
MVEFLMPIGDWSGDGHGMCKYYLICSNKPFEEVERAHHKIKDNTGIDLESICADYQENEISCEMKDMLDETGFNTANLKVNPFDEEAYVMTADDLCQLWIFLLMKADSELQLTVKSLETLSGNVGYGVFF